MRATALLLFSFVLVLSSSCKEEDDPLPTTVQIEGENYAIAKIGKHTWTTENYKGAGGVPYGTGAEKPEYGKYYTYAEATAVVLPAGWRIPTIEDYTALAESQGVVFTLQRANKQQAIKKLASVNNWRLVPGNNASGFNAQPAGYIYQNLGPTDGDLAEFWVADTITASIQESFGGTAHTMLFYESSPEGYRFNLRFVKDN